MVRKGCLKENAPRKWKKSLGKSYLRLQMVGKLTRRHRTSDKKQQRTNHYLVGLYIVDDIDVIKTF